MSTEFVFPKLSQPDDVYRVVQRGMTLRDYFAGQALLGVETGGEVHSIEGTAKFVYAIADAMLIVREITNHDQ